MRDRCPDKNSFERSSKGFLLISLGEAEDVRFQLSDPPEAGSSEIAWKPQPVTEEYIKYRDEQPIEERTWKFLRDRVNDEFFQEDYQLFERMVEIIMEGYGPSHAQTGHSRASQSYDNYARLPQIRKPALILAGREDRTVPLDNIFILKERIPGAELVVMDKVRHFMLWESFDESNRIILDFLRTHSEVEN